MILAASSPRRVSMFREHGISPVISPPDVDEELPSGIVPEQAVMFLSLKKALSTEKKVLAGDIDLSSTGGKRLAGDEGNVIVAADTVVVFDGNIIGKPVNRDEARHVLTALRNNEHFVYTGVALIRAGTTHRRVFCERSSVFFGDYTDMELEEYISTDEPYDKAGGYAIQGTFGRFVDRFDGDIDNIIGLPWARMTEELKAL